MLLASVPCAINFILIYVDFVPHLLIAVYVQAGFCRTRSSLENQVLHKLLTIELES